MARSPSPARLQTLEPQLGSPKIAALIHHTCLGRIPSHRLCPCPPHHSHRDTNNHQHRWPRQALPWMCYQDPCRQLFLHSTWGHTRMDAALPIRSPVPTSVDGRAAPPDPMPPAAPRIEWLQSSQLPVLPPIPPREIHQFPPGNYPYLAMAEDSPWLVNASLMVAMESSLDYQILGPRMSIFGAPDGYRPTSSHWLHQRSGPQQRGDMLQCHPGLHGPGSLHPQVPPRTSRSRQMDHHQ